MSTIREKVQQAIDTTYPRLAQISNTNRNFCLAAGRIIDAELSKILDVDGVLIDVVRKPNLTPGYAVRVTHGKEVWELDLRPSNQ